MPRLMPLAVAAVVLVAGCSDGTQPRVVLYSGRSKSLVEPLVERYEKNRNVNVEVRYGRDAALLAALEEEGKASEVDVFWANTAGALGAAAEKGLLGKLPASIRETPSRFVPNSGLWTPVTTRFRVLAYHTDRVGPEELPDSVLDTEGLAAHEGRIGWTPTYSSFQDFVTAMRVRHGPERTKQWLAAVKELNPKSYRSNTAMLQAMLAGEIDVALTNHYYVHRLKHGGPEGEYEGHEEEEEHEGHAAHHGGEAPATATRPRTRAAQPEHGEHEEHEEGEPRPKAPIASHHFAEGDVGNLALVTGASVLANAPRPERGHAFVKYLLSAPAQRYAAQRVHEYPVVAGVEVPDHLLPVERATRLSPEIDFAALRNIQPTLALLREVGLL